jgi:PAS domain S-box-containing protein
MGMLLGLLYFVRDFIQDVLLNSQQYFLTEHSIEQTNVNIIFIAIISIIVLISFIFYLLVTFNSRFNLMVWNETKTLSIAKDQFKKLYENTPVAFMLLDKNGNIHSPNKATLRFFGAFAEDLEDKNFFSYITDGSKEKAEDLLKYYKLKIPINRKESQMITKNGSLKEVMISVFDMRGPGSVTIEGIAVILDITEQKLVEKAKTEFLSLASHQLKTPLATTKWYTEMLMSDETMPLNEKYKGYLEVLYTANQEMIELVDVLLNISRIEMGSMTTDKIPTNIQNLFESIFEEFKLQINTKRINIVKNYDNLFTEIRSDPRLLRVVIQNIISNSVKYTPNEGTITITFEDISGEKKIIISDTGVGIPKDQQEHIFQKMFRADNVKKLANSQGTGLGLYLVKSIIVAMGGNIQFSSEENKGSIFTIKL